MNLGAWGVVVVNAAAEAAERAAAGAAYLDARLGPDWDRLVETERLDIGSPFHCVLYQINRRGMQCLPGLRLSVDGGFSCGLVGDFASLVYRWPSVRRAFTLLTDAWRELLIRRRGLTAPLDAARPSEVRRHRDLVAGAKPAA